MFSCVPMLTPPRRLACFCIFSPVELQLIARGAAQEGDFDGNLGVLELLPEGEFD